jgi:hypothetical protein
MRTISDTINIVNFSKATGSIRTRTGFKREFIFECPMCDCKISNRTFILDSHWLDFVKKHLDEHNTVNKK